ncbi:tRNA (guanosine(37)-N1)-methyltransferase TrmD [Chlamydia sp. 17-3921]|uniref:tRNA (guanosine(37)-N1)-methyltransferase TrmD n=1 Tax=Chlamydia sp. 17-3921 TaxID=2675798 RepID=UPI001919E65D|nr:tRNA (guanosine(37)-N1)-methyltransferase TrmD [Chlamydia sp. 17-3921]
MEIDIISLFPDYFDSPLKSSVLGRAIKKKLLTIRSKNLRDFGVGKWKQVDDEPFSGGGMLLMAEPVVNAIRSVKTERSRVIYLSPQGSLLTAKKSRELAQIPHLILLCGHYEGIDERAIDNEVYEEISIGDYVLTNGGLAALVLIDTLSRFIPGVLGNQESFENDSLENGLLKGPQYTRPRVFEGKEVPEILLGGNHKAIASWRKQISLERTRQRRLDLYLRNLYNYCTNNPFDSKQEDPHGSSGPFLDQITVVVEVEILKRAKIFYTKVFGLSSSKGREEWVYLSDQNKPFLWLREVGLERKKITTFSLYFCDEKSFYRVLAKWELLGGILLEKQVHDNLVVVRAQDLDGHTWELSLRNVE